MTYERTLHLRLVTLVKEFVPHFRSSEHETHWQGLSVTLVVGRFTVNISYQRWWSRVNSFCFPVRTCEQESCRRGHNLAIASKSIAQVRTRTLGPHSTSPAKIAGICQRHWWPNDHNGFPREWVLWCPMMSQSRQFLTCRRALSEHRVSQKGCSVREDIGAKTFPSMHTQRYGVEGVNGLLKKFSASLRELVCCQTIRWSARGDQPVHTWLHYTIQDRGTFSQ